MGFSSETIVFMKAHFSRSNVVSNNSSVQILTGVVINVVKIVMLIYFSVAKIVEIAFLKSYF